MESGAIRLYHFVGDFLHCILYLIKPMHDQGLVYVITLFTYFNSAHKYDAILP